MTTKRIYKLTFLLGKNINDELSLLKVKKDNDWYIFDEDQQSPELHPLILKKINSSKLKKDNTKEFDYYFTENEYSTYFKNNQFIFNDTLLSKDDELSFSFKKFKKSNNLDYRNLNYIDFFTKFERENSNLTSSEKFSKLEQCIEDEELLNFIKLSKFQLNFTNFMEEFERKVDKKHVSFIVENENVYFDLNGTTDLNLFASKYFDFCKIAYPKSTFRENLSRFIPKIPKRYRSFLLKCKQKELNSYLEDIKVINKIIKDDYNERIKLLEKTLKAGRYDSVTKTRFKFTATELNNLCNQSLKADDLDDLSNFNSLVNTIVSNCSA